jgi:hypothetical protein
MGVRLESDVLTTDDHELHTGNPCQLIGFNNTDLLKSPVPIGFKYNKSAFGLRLGIEKIGQVCCVGNKYGILVFRRHLRQDTVYHVQEILASFRVSGAEINDTSETSGITALALAVEGHIDIYPGSCHKLKRADDDYFIAHRGRCN